ncbi:MAG TPA: AI-2E family transporter [Lichenihabitans sp.]|jgi:predicted PurR-regulated permease PerM|nr:AI-2E family transporter [Lichenihabitans sp.]
MSLQRQIFIWAVVLCVFVYILYALSGVLLPFVAGMTIGYLLDPLANRLERWGLSRLGATALILGLFVILLLVLLVLFVPILAHQFTAFLLNLPVIAARLQALVVEEIVKLADRYGGETLKAFGLTAGLTQAEVQNSVNSFVGQWSNYLVAFLNQLWSGSRALFGVFSLLIVTPVVAFYILLDWKRMVAAIDGWIPLPHRESVRSIARDIDAALAGFVRGQSLVSLVLGLWYSIGLTLVGLNFGFLIGISGGVLSFVPYIGSLIVLLLATAVAVVQGWPDWTLIAETLAVVVAGQFLEGNVLSPSLVGASIGLHPVWLMFALVAFSTIFGFTGLLVAVPLSAAAGVLSRFALRKYLLSSLYTGDPRTAFTDGRT